MSVCMAKCPKYVRDEFKLQTVYSNILQQGYVDIFNTIVNK